MNIEIFSDVVCPWCAIGKHRFEQALAKFEHADEVDVVWRSFELDPAAPAEAEGDLASHLATKYGVSREQALVNQARLTEMAAAEGLDFHFEMARRANTFDAHRLLHWAYEVGAQNALKDRLFRAYFVEGASIADRETLVALAAEVGLDGEKCAEILDSSRYEDEVRADEAEARTLGISGVPFFVIDRKYGISGAQSPETILGALEQAWSEAYPAQAIVGESLGTCEGGSCDLPT